MNIIFACDKKYGIGINNKLPPWKIKGDLVRFSKLTTGDGNNVVLMGKNTYLSLPNQYLKNRQNIVVSNTLFEKYSENHNKIMYCGEDIIYSIQNNTIFLPNFSDAYKYAKHYVSNNYQSGVIGEIWAIGGSLIYEKAIELNLINNIYVTYVNETYKCDTFLSDRTIIFLNKHKNKIKELVKSYHIGYDEHEYCIYVY